MALETLAGVSKIGGFDVHEDNEIANGKWSDVDSKYSICVHHGDNTIAFRIQNGPIKEHGVNGCQVDTLINAAKMIVEGLDAKYPCDENKEAVKHLGLAMSALINRTKNRESRGVEGTSNA